MSGIPATLTPAGEPAAGLAVPLGGVCADAGHAASTTNATAAIILLRRIVLRRHEVMMRLLNRR